VPQWLPEQGDAEAIAMVSLELESLRLSRRQREVLPLLAQGMSAKEIARELNIAVGTAKIHTAALLHALGARNRTEAAFFAAKIVQSKASSDGKDSEPVSGKLRDAGLARSGGGPADIGQCRPSNGARTRTSWPSFSYIADTKLRPLGIAIEADQSTSKGESAPKQRARRAGLLRPQGESPGATSSARAGPRPRTQTRQVAGAALSSPAGNPCLRYSAQPPFTIDW
jgi:DNA-binding CsgD family transcriptional regulator